MKKQRKKNPSLASSLDAMNIHLSGIQKQQGRHTDLLDKVFDKQETLGKDVAEMKGKCETRMDTCTAERKAISTKACGKVKTVEREVTVWRRINYFIIIVVVVGGLGAMLFGVLRSWGR